MLQFTGRRVDNSLVTMTSPTVAPRVPDREPARPAVVALTDVHRSFGGNPALQGLSLEVPLGTITVLLGPNGAGKTTAIRVVTGALGPDRGDVRVFGLDPAVDGEDVRRRCGVVSAKPALYDRLSGLDNLVYAAELYGIPRGAPMDEAIAEATERFAIADALSQQVGGYSTGMKTRLALARSVLHRPDLLLFDEPTSGLDPESSYAVLELIRSMTSVGATVVMCTHLLLEAEGLADQVVVLDDGRDLIRGAPDELTKRYWPTAMVRVDAEDRVVASAVLQRMEGVAGVDPDPNGFGPLRVSVDDHERVPELVFGLAAAGVRVTRVEPFVPSLEDLYFTVRGHRR